MDYARHNTRVSMEELDWVGHGSVHVRGLPKLCSATGAWYRLSGAALVALHEA